MGFVCRFSVASIPMFPTSIGVITTIRISMRFNPTSYRFQTPFFIRCLLVCNTSWWTSPVSPCPITDTGWHHELHRHPLVHPAAAAGRLWSTPSWSVPAIDSWTWPPRPSWRRPAAPGSAGEAQQDMGSITRRRLARERKTRLSSSSEYGSGKNTERDALSPHVSQFPRFHMSGQTTWQITYESLLGKMLRLRNSCLWICSVTNKQTWGTPDSDYISNSQERKSHTENKRKKKMGWPPPPLDGLSWLSWWL